MRKVLVFFLIAFLLFAAACGQKTTTNGENNESSVVTEDNLQAQNQNMQSFRNFTYDETYYYLVIDKAIHRIHRKTKETEVIYSDKAVCRLLAYHGNLYFSATDNETYGDFYRMDLSDFSCSRLGSMSWSFFGSNNNLYYDQDLNLIYNPLNSDIHKKIATAPAPIHADDGTFNFSVYPDAIYYTTYAYPDNEHISATVYQMDLNGVERKELFKAEGMV